MILEAELLGFRGLNDQVAVEDGASGHHVEEIPVGH